MFGSNLQQVFGVRYAPVRMLAMAALSAGYLGLRADGVTTADWLFAAASVVLGGLASAFPLAAAIALAALLAVAATVGGDGPAVMLVKIFASFALFELAARRPARWAGIAAVALVAGSLAGKVDRLPQDLPAIGYGLVVVLGVPLLLGTQLRSAWRLTEQAEQRARAEAQRAEAEIRRRASDARAARASERVTIARELHDLVAHQIASILLRVGVAREVLPDLGQATKETLDDVHDCAATVLDDLRRLVRMLRSGEGISLIEPKGLREAIEETTERGRQLGLDITASFDESIGHIDAVRALTVLRLCQEGLTNVAKHGGPTARVSIAIRHDPEGAIRLEIDDDGGGRQPETISDGSGFGLIGMRERVELLGGELDVGPTSDGWRLRAVLPEPTDTVPAPVAAEPRPAVTS